MTRASRFPRAVLLLATAVTLAACAERRPAAQRVATPLTPLPPLPPEELSASFGSSTPEEQGIDSTALTQVADWVRDQPDLPIYSILISRNGKLVFELYTSVADRNDAHYLMSATKSFASAAVGIAIDQGLLPDADAPITQSDLRRPELHTANYGWYW